jgi:hypothetical protein
MAERRRIKKEGHLIKLARMVARRKALDYMKASFWRCRDHGADLGLMADTSGGVIDYIDLLDTIHIGFSHLGESTRSVFKLRIQMFLDDGYPPTTAQLAVEFSRRARCKTTYNSIKGHLQRGREVLRPYFAERGLFP